MAGAAPAAGVVLLVAGLLSACSSPSATASPEPQPTPTDATPTKTPPPAAGLLRELVRAAADATAGSGTAAVLQTIGFQGSRTVPDGPYASVVGHVTFGDRRQMVVDANYAGAGFGVFEMIRLQDLLLVRGRLLGDMVDPGRWLLVDLTSEDERVASFAAVSGLQDDAFLVLYGLYGGTGLVEALGRDTLDGVATTRYSLRVDLEVAAREAPEGIRDLLRARYIDEAAEALDLVLEFDAWIDDAGFVRRIDTVADLLAEQGGGQEIVSFRYAQLGEPYELTIPRDEEIVHLEDIPATSGRA